MGGAEAVGSGKVVLRKGFAEFIEGVEKRRANLGIVSVNFSGAFIRGVLMAGFGNLAIDIPLLANYVDEKTGVLEGPFRRDGGEHVAPIATSDAKLAAMRSLLRPCGEDISKTVYFGDSVTDLECLTEADVMSDDHQSNLMAVVKRLGLEVRPVGEYQEKSLKTLY